MSQCESLKTADCYVQLNSTDPSKTFGQILKILEVRAKNYFLIQYFKISNFKIIRNVKDPQLKRAINKFYELFHLVEVNNSYDIVDVSTVMNKCISIPYKIQEKRSYYVLTNIVDPFEHD